MLDINLMNILYLFNKCISLRYIYIDDVFEIKIIVMIYVAMFKVQSRYNKSVK